MAISKRLRYEILRRDNHACRYCGGVAPDVVLTVDYVVPVALGGGDEPSNLVAACRDCNAGKSSMSALAVVVDDVAADALRWSKAMSQVAELRERESESDRDIWGWFNEIWCRWTDWRGDPLPAGNDGYGRTIHKFLSLGLTRQEIESLVYVAMDAGHIGKHDKWKYFCGCCWRRVRENQEMAAAILKAEESPKNG